jgi:hypothetical protein
MNIKILFFFNRKIFIRDKNAQQIHQQNVSQIIVVVVIFHGKNSMVNQHNVNKKTQILM